MATRDVLEPFLGLWVDVQGRALFIRRRDGDERDKSPFEAEVSVTDGVMNMPYEVRGPGLNELPIRQMRATMANSELRAEAGVIGIGPTYTLQLSADDTLLPRVEMGLHDDWEQDLGVPWAFPLAPYRRATLEEREHWSAARAAMMKK